jgi:hypothetical protein
MGVNTIKQPYVHVWKCHNKTHDFVQLVYANKDYKEERNPVIFNNMDIPGVLYIKWNKTDTEKIHFMMLLTYVILNQGVEWWWTQRSKWEGVGQRAQSCSYVGRISLKT